MQLQRVRKGSGLGSRSVCPRGRGILAELDGLRALSPWFRVLTRGSPRSKFREGFQLSPPSPPPTLTLARGQGSQVAWGSLQLVRTTSLGALPSFERDKACPCLTFSTPSAPVLSCTSQPEVPACQQEHPASDQLEMEHFHVKGCTQSD